MKESTAKITRNVIVLGVVSLFTDAASEMIYPLVPIFITMLGSKEKWERRKAELMAGKRWVEIIY